MPADLAATVYILAVALIVFSPNAWLIVQRRATAD